MSHRSAVWSASAGLYAFLLAVALLVFLDPVVGTLAKLVGIPGGYAPVAMAVPAAAAGAVAWWTIVERRRRYRYGLGAFFGVAVAGLTVLVWVLVFAVVWGPRLVLSGWFLVAVVFGVTSLAGSLTGMPLMYVRRRLRRDPGGGQSAAGSPSADR
jgi:hypothetical protein